MYSINHDNTKHFKNVAHKYSVRWGYTWNNEVNNFISSDVGGGIGLEWHRTKTHVTGAGDIFDCCGVKAPSPGVGRQTDDAAYRVLIFGRKGKKGH
jgi:hypothetical protein